MTPQKILTLPLMDIINAIVQLVILIFYNNVEIMMPRDVAVNQMKYRAVSYTYTHFASDYWV